MGNIATPDMTASPMQTIRDLWGGELPEFETQEDAEILLTGLMQGLWNGLSNHQKRTSPFKLTRVKTEQPSWEALARLSLIRREELDGFIEGLFAGHDEIDLPEKAHGATNILGELRAMIAGVHELATTKAAPTDVMELEGLIKQIRELSIIAEKRSTWQSNRANVPERKCWKPMLPRSRCCIDGRGSHSIRSVPRPAAPAPC